MAQVFLLLVKILFFLLCSGVAYFPSNLVRVLTVPEIKVLSLDFTTVLVSTFLLSSVVRDIRAGMVDGDKVGSRPELGDEEDKGVEELIDASKTDEASEVFAASEAQKVQFDIAR